MTLRTEDNARLTREAAEWFMELQTEGSACHAEFARWLRRSPEHIEEFLAISGIARKLDDIDPQHRIDVHQLLADDGAEIIRLTQPAPVRRGARTHRSFPVWITGLVAASVVAGVFAWFQWTMHRPEVYVTRVGEQRAFKLPDGSLIHLNTQSRAELNFSEHAREVRLLEGEALFAVERDAHRPFRVISDDTTVQALGTQFNVYRLADGKTTVSVMEGAVQVTTESAPAKTALASAVSGNEPTDGAPMRLNAGEQASIRAGRVEKGPLPDPESVTAWRQRRLVFRDKPLSEVVAEFNRYNTAHFEVEAAAGREPLSGVFAADRPESLLLFLERDRSVHVEKQGDRLLIRSNREH